MQNNERTDLHLPSAGAEAVVSHDGPPPALWRQLDAFRELLLEGERLLGEVLAFTRSAEQTLVELQAGKASADRELERLRVERDECIHTVETLSAELAALRAVPAPVVACAPVSVPEGQGPLEQRLRTAEQELERTRLVLAGERLRRNRAIDLIRPAGRVAPGGPQG
jgi:hypothetical protein